MKLLNILALLITFMCFSCNRTHDSQAIDRIKSRKSLITGYEQKYAYDSEGRILKLTRPGRLYTYRYENDRVIEMEDDSVMGRYSESVFYLNKMGLADSEITRQTSNHELMGMVYWKYDDNGFMIEQFDSAPGATNGEIRRQTIKDGNIMSTTHYSGSGQLFRTSYYVYDTAHLNTLGNTKRGMGFLGTDSRNAIQDLIIVSANSDTLHNGFWRSHFDERGKLNTSATYDTLGKLKDSTLYSYY